MVQKTKIATNFTLIRICISLIAFIFSTNINAQMTFNKHNPYVTNSEIHKLKVLKIDLFEKSITDPDFKKNVSALLANQKDYNEHKNKRALFITIGALGAAMLTAGILVGEKRSSTTLPFKNNYIRGGLLIGATGGIGFMVNRPQFLSVRSKYHQQLEITKGQYDVLIKN